MRVYNIHPGDVWQMLSTCFCELKLMVVDHTMVVVWHVTIQSMSRAAASQEDFLVLAGIPYLRAARQ